MPSGIVEIESNKETKFKGFVTAPASGVYPGILLLHQEYGLDANIRAIAEYYAANNYTVFVPDLFWRDLPGCELNSLENSDIKTSENIIEKFNIDQSLNDVTLCLKWLRETPQCNGLVSTIGFGVGSNLSYLSGLWLDIESSVCYNFNGSKFFKENDTFIRRPMLLHLSNDIYEGIKIDKKENFIKGVNNINLNVYSDCYKNFYRIADKNYNDTNTTKANKLTLSHIKESFAKPHNT